MAQEKDDFLDQEDMTGMSAQNDPEFLNEPQVASDLEKELEGMDDFDSEAFDASLSSYEHFIVLPKRELSSFIRAVEPLTKTTVDQYGKSVQISSVDKDTVCLKYSNKPYRVMMKISNKSQKIIDTFCIEVSLLKRIVAEQYASVVIVQTEEGYSLSIFDSLLFLETKKLNDEEFAFDETRKPKKAIDKELGIYNFRKLGSILSTSDRASEKIIIVKEKECLYNVGVFSAKVKSPFAEVEKILLFKPVVDLLAVLMELAKVDVRYDVISEDLMLIDADGIIRCEVPISTDIEQHYSPAVMRNLDFQASIVIVNDSMTRLLSLVKSLDYLSDIVTITFTDDEMQLTIHNQQMTKSSCYSFKIIDGQVKEKGDMKVSSSVVKTYFEVAGLEVKYDFNELGLRMSNDNGSFLIRKSN